MTRKLLPRVGSRSSWDAPDLPAPHLSSSVHRRVRLKPSRKRGRFMRAQITAFISIPFETSLKEPARRNHAYPGQVRWTVGTGGNRDFCMSKARTVFSVLVLAQCFPWPTQL